MLIPELTLICRLLVEPCHECNFSYRLPLLIQQITLDGSVSFTYREKREPRGRLAGTSRCPPWLINTSFPQNSLKKSILNHDYKPWHMKERRMQAAFQNSYTVRGKTAR
jgi:hypothetical protein